LRDYHVRVTTSRVAGDEVHKGQATADALKAWRQVRDSPDIQFAPLPPFKPSPPPPWLDLLGRLLRAIFEPIGRALGMSWPVVQYVLIAAGIVLVLFVLWRLIAPAIAARRKKPDASEPGWTPDPVAARALLADADRLAGEGQFGEAVHLLLRRSIDEIAKARPEWLRPASTAREIAALAKLPERARSAFAVLAARVERSRFALLGLDRSDWEAARAAYADFALADFGR
jgi:hypothetical protein